MTATTAAEAATALAALEALLLAHARTLSLEGPEQIAEDAAGLVDDVTWHLEDVLDFLDANADVSEQAVRNLVFCGEAMVVRAQTPLGAVTVTLRSWPQWPDQAVTVTADDRRWLRL